MDDQSINKFVEEKMKDMEVVPNTRKKVSVDDLGSTVCRSTLDLRAVNQKYTPAGATPSDDSASNPHPDLTSGSIKVKIVQAKDRTQDSSTPANTRTNIFDDEGRVGSQG